MSPATTTRNNAVDIFRYICAILVVSIHAHPLQYINETANYVLIEHISRIAVPFFFIVSGYFYSLRYYAGKRPFGGYMKKLLSVYTLWSAVYVIERVILRGGVSFPELLRLLSYYFYMGTSQHLWFCLSLMAAICVLELVCRRRGERVLTAVSLLLFAVGCLGNTYYHCLGQHIPLLKEMYCLSGYLHIQRYAIYGVTFVTMGNLIARHRERLLQTKNNTLCILLCVLLLAFIGERVTAERLAWASGGIYSIMLYPLMLTLFVLLLKHPAPAKGKAAAFCGASATFMYYFHPLVLDTVNAFWDAPLLAFVAGVAVSTLLAVGLKKLNNKTVNYWLL